MGKLIGGRTATRRKVNERLSAYIDGELGASERVRLERQFAGDADLRAELAALRRTIALVQDLPPVAVPRNFLLPQTTAAQLHVGLATRPRLAWAAPLLTAASTVVSLLFVAALAGSFFGTAQLRQTVAPPDAFEASEAPAAMAEDFAVEAEMAVTVEVEAPVSVERAGEKAAAPTEEVAGEEAPIAAPSEGEGEAGGATTGEPQPAPVPADEALEAEAQGAQALEVAAEDAEESAALPFGTLSAERAEEPAAAQPPAAAGMGGGEPTPSPPSAQEVLEPTAAAAGDNAQMADDEEPQQFLDSTDVERPSAKDSGRSGVTVEPEHITPPSETEPTASRQTPPLAPPFPWCAVQIGLGSSAFVLIIATIWAWRLRR